jgi:hypothetical protein
MKVVKLTTRHSADLLRRFATCVVTMAATSVTATALAAEAAADHDTVGGGTFAVYNSDGGCTDFQGDSTPYTLCNGGWVNLTGATKYIAVPLGPHISVGCNTYAPDGSLFEHDDENLAEVPRKQRFWAEQGWGPYTPEALCQLW